MGSESQRPLTTEERLKLQKYISVHADYNHTEDTQYTVQYGLIMAIETASVLHVICPLSVLEGIEVPIIDLSELDEL